MDEVRSTVKKALEEQIMRARLKGSERIHREIVGKSIDGIIKTTLQDDRIISVNPSYCNIIGYSAGELVGNSTLDLDIWVNPKQDWQYMHDRLRKDGEINDFVFKVNTKEEGIKTVSLTSRTIYDKNKKPIQQEGILRDITERMSMEANLQKQIMDLKRVIDSLPFNIYVIDASNYAMLWVSTAGDPKKRWRKLPCYQYLHNREVSCENAGYVCPLNTIKKTKKPITLQHVHYGEYNKRVYCKVDAYPIFDENKNVVQIIEIATETDENQKDEMDLIKQRLDIKDKA